MSLDTPPILNSMLTTDAIQQWWRDCPNASARHEYVASTIRFDDADDFVPSRSETGCYRLGTIAAPER